MARKIRHSVRPNARSTYDGNGVGCLQDLTEGLAVVLNYHDSRVDEQGSEQL